MSSIVGRVPGLTATKLPPKWQGLWLNGGHPSADPLCPSLLLRPCSHNAWAGVQSVNGSVVATEFDGMGVTSPGEPGASYLWRAGDDSLAHEKVAEKQTRGSIPAARWSWCAQPAHCCALLSRHPALLPMCGQVWPH